MVRGTVAIHPDFISPIKVNEDGTVDYYSASSDEAPLSDQEREFVRLVAANLSKGYLTAEQAAQRLETFGIRPTLLQRTIAKGLHG